jgi:glycerol kinase
MEADAGLPVKEVRVDGGATINNHLMQFQSDLLNTAVVRPSITETTALGAAYLAGLGIGFWNNLDELQQYWQKDKVFKPAMDEAKRNDLQKHWKKAIRAAQAWTEEN